MTRKNPKTKIIIIFFIVLGILAVGILFSSPKGDSLKEDAIGPEFQNLIGTQAPDFNIADINGNDISSKDMKGKIVVLFVNEGLACYPACWDQMLKLEEDLRFQRNDMVVISVVGDSRESWKKAIALKPELGKINVAFDINYAASKSLGMTNTKSSMHPGVPGHTYMIIDKNGKIVYVYDDPKMGINNDKIFKAVQNII